MSFNKSTPPNPSQRVLPTGDQKFKQMSPWGTFSFRTPHPHNTHIYIHSADTHAHSYIYAYRYTHKHNMCTDIHIIHLSLQVPGSVPLMSIFMIPYP